MKNFKYIISFFLFSINIISGQTTDTISDNQIKIETKYGTLIVNKSTRGQNSYISVHSFFYADYECPVLDYTVWVNFYTGSDGSLSKYEILKNGKNKCLENAVAEFCQELVLKTKEKNINWLFSTDLSQCSSIYRLPIKIHIE